MTTTPAVAWIGLGAIGAPMARALAGSGPNVVVVRTLLRMWAPSHLEEAAPVDDAGLDPAETTRPEGPTA